MALSLILGYYVGFKHAEPVVKGQAILATITVFWNVLVAWWRHQMETFSALLAIFAGKSPVLQES